MVLVQAERVREEITPAVFQTITKKVLVEPGRALPIQVQPEFAHIPVTTVQKQAQVNEFKVEPKTEALPLTVYTSAPQLTWRRVLCEKDASPILVRQLQEALQQKGYPVGSVDGKLGQRTVNAIDKFQHDNELATGLLTYEAMESLGILN